MRLHRRKLIIAASVGAAVTAAFGHSYGPPPRVTGAPGDNPKACTQCHADGALNGFNGSVSIVLQSGAVYIPGVKQRITVQVADPAQQRWGFELTARLNSNPSSGQAGQLIPIDNMTQVICEDNGPEPCTSGVSFIQHTTAGTRNGTKNGVSFQFDWVPPATNAGSITMYVAGNAANGNSSFTGDHIYTSSIQLDPLTPAAPTTAAANLVSAATLQAGPVAPNSWVTVFGTNLAVTTRSWTADDFIDGGLPVSLDGVSVVLTVGGAPRFAYVGYVSPTQVNFLMPSDAAATAYQVQIKNPAGLTPQIPMTVQANAGQMLTLDGKYVAGAHANGTLVGKSGLISSTPTKPAAPGETISIYATGCGSTSPALISGQVPTQALTLATLPQATIGGVTANVVSASVVPGSPGMYQINVQVPQSVPTGDQPVVFQLGTTSTASALLTVQN
ncbi:MAG TPA: choice-of-anchor V domain-containing protein [Bryobacteraceae bacterium]|jgi:uncharacterized protein (TIGR03437 family)